MRGAPARRKGQGAAPILLSLDVAEATRAPAWVVGSLDVAYAESLVVEGAKAREHA